MSEPLKPSPPLLPPIDPVASPAVAPRPPQLPTPCSPPSSSTGGGGTSIPHPPAAGPSSTNATSVPTADSGNNGSSTKGPQIRVRQTRACTLCRVAKVRCDGAIDPPCARCKRHNVECVFVESRRGKQGPHHIKPFHAPPTASSSTASSSSSQNNCGGVGSNKPDVSSGAGAGAGSHAGVAVVNSELLRWILDTYKPTPGPFPPSFLRVDKMHLDALASFGFVQLSTFLAAVNLCFGVESADGHGNRSTAVLLAPPGDPAGAIVTGVQRVLTREPRKPTSPPPTTTRPLLLPIPHPQPHPLSFPPPPPHQPSLAPTSAPLEGGGIATTDQDMDELDSESDSSHFDSLDDDLDLTSVSTPSSLSLSLSHSLPNPAPPSSSHSHSHSHSHPPETAKPHSLRSLSLSDFIAHMCAVDPSRAQLYVDTKTVLEAEAIGSDVLARVGLGMLVRIGVKIGVASRMLAELEG